MLLNCKLMNLRSILAFALFQCTKDDFFNIIWKLFIITILIKISTILKLIMAELMQY